MSVDVKKIVIKIISIIYRVYITFISNDWAGHNSTVDMYIAVIWNLHWKNVRNDGDISSYIQTVPKILGKCFRMSTSVHRETFTEKLRYSEHFKTTVALDNLP